MTIIAGFLSFDGCCVIASDSQETVSDYSKNSTDKIRHINISPQWRLIFAAAGHAAYADMLQAKIEAACSQEPAFDFDIAEKIISEQLLSLHREHIWPRPIQDRPSIESLIVVQQLQAVTATPEALKLFATSDTAVFPVDHYRAIGVGAHMADYLYDSCFWPVMSVEELETSAVYMLEKIKQSIVGCDGETVIGTFFTSGTFLYKKTSEVKQIEAALGSLDHSFKKIFRGAVMETHPRAELKKDIKESEKATSEVRALLKTLHSRRPRNAR